MKHTFVTPWKIQYITDAQITVRLRYAGKFALSWRHVMNKEVREFYAQSTRAVLLEHLRDRLAVGRGP